MGSGLSIKRCDAAWRIRPDRAWPILDLAASPALDPDELRRSCRDLRLELLATEEPWRQVELLRSLATHRELLAGLVSPVRTGATGEHPAIPTGVTGEQPGPAAGPTSNGAGVGTDGTRARRAAGPHRSDRRPTGSTWAGSSAGSGGDGRRLDEPPETDEHPAVRSRSDLPHESEVDHDRARPEASPSGPVDRSSIDPSPSGPVDRSSVAPSPSPSGSPTAAAPEEAVVEESSDRPAEERPLTMRYLLEGPAGAGTTTIVELMAEHFETPVASSPVTDRGPTVRWLEFSAGSFEGQPIRFEVCALDGPADRSVRRYLRTLVDATIVVVASTPEGLEAGAERIRELVADGAGRSELDRADLTVFAHKSDLDDAVALPEVAPKLGLDERVRIVATTWERRGSSHALALATSSALRRLVRRDLAGRPRTVGLSRQGFLTLVRGGLPSRADDGSGTPPSPTVSDPGLSPLWTASPTSPSAMPQPDVGLEPDRPRFEPAPPSARSDGRSHRSDRPGDTSPPPSPGPGSGPPVVAPEAGRPADGGYAAAPAPPVAADDPIPDVGPPPPPAVHRPASDEHRDNGRNGRPTDNGSSADPAHTASASVDAGAPPAPPPAPQEPADRPPPRARPIVEPAARGAHLTLRRSALRRLLDALRG